MPRTRLQLPVVGWLLTERNYILRLPAVVLFAAHEKPSVPAPSSLYPYLSLIPFFESRYNWLLLFVLFEIQATTWKSDDPNAAPVPPTEWKKVLRRSQFIVSLNISLRLDKGSTRHVFPLQYILRLGLTIYAGPLIRCLEPCQYGLSITCLVMSTGATCLPSYANRRCPQWHPSGDVARRQPFGHNIK